jgi:hypothetical protein
MLDFTFEVIDESTINIQILYASEWFTFNLYLRNQVWTLHPFDGILIQNSDMCRLVIGDLFKNKNFHVMCAKENIRLSELRSSISVEDEPATEEPTPVINRGGGGMPSPDIQSFIDEHSIEDIVELEKEAILKRSAFYKQILENMFMQGYGPADKEFLRIQAIVNIWNETYNKISGSSDHGPLGERKRW